ncbi:MAG: hypothetical protein ACFB4J_07355 [Elainellaceae cyanobacterium]
MAIVPLLLLLLLVGGVLLTEVLAYLPLYLIHLLHIPQWIGWFVLCALVVGLMGDRRQPFD